MKNTIPPIELEIIHNALTAAAAEMDVTVWRTSRSTIVRELLDYSTAIFDRDGRNVAQAARIPMPPQLHELLSQRDPRPAHSAGAVAGRTTSSSRTTPIAAASTFPTSSRSGRCSSTGGASGSSARCATTSMSADHRPAATVRARSRFSRKGLRIPPLKLFEHGKLNEAVRALILQNVRQPEILWGDLQSQIASLHIGAASVERLATKVGEGRFERALEQLLDTSEAGMRAVIGRIPDGTYEFEDDIDDDGVTDRPIRIHAKVMVAGDEMTVDLSGCGPQAVGPSNATLASTCSAVFYALMASADVPMASNAGCYRPVRIVAPEGLCVNAAYPAPVVHRIAIAHRLATVLFGALHRAIPDRMPAAYYAVSYVVAFQTIDPGLGRKVLVEVEIGGCGALPYGTARRLTRSASTTIPIFRSK